MTSSNRATKYETLHKSLKKHYKPGPDTPDRSVLDHLLYACCLENARYEQADEAFAKLQQAYFDWNEVRVTTAVELGEALQSLPHSAQAGTRIKQCLQALFESRYQYDIDDLKKANLGKAVAELEAWKGITPFIVSYVSQHALGGHSIPISQLILDALVQCEVITPSEAEKHTVPGLERAIPKNKGTEFASLVHQFAVELHLHPKSSEGLAVLKDLGATYKPKPKIEPKPVNRPTSTKLGTDRPAARPPKASEPSAAAPGRLPAKAAPVQPSPSSGKKSEAKKGEVETGKPVKTTDSKLESKSISAKKMVPPPATTKVTPAKKNASAEKKNAAPIPPSAKGAKKKVEPSKGNQEESKNKQSPKPKSSATNGKSEAKPATKKGMSPGKPTGGGSIASSITKKKPK